jgi:hypothetical protein
LQCQIIGNPQVLMKKGRGVELGKPLVYLRAYAMNQNQTNPQAAKQSKIVDVMIKIISQHRFATKRNNKGFVAMRVNVG